MVRLQFVSVQFVKTSGSTFSNNCFDQRTSKQARSSDLKFNLRLPVTQTRDCYITLKAMISKNEKIFTTTVEENKILTGLLNIQKVRNLPAWKKKIYFGR